MIFLFLKTVRTILVEGIMGNIQVNYFKFGPVVQEMLFKYISFLTLVAFAPQRKNVCTNLVEGIMWNIQVNYFHIWTSDSGDVVYRFFYL